MNPAASAPLAVASRPTGLYQPKTRVPHPEGLERASLLHREEGSYLVAAGADHADGRRQAQDPWITGDGEDDPGQQ